MKSLKRIFFILILTGTLGQFFSDLYLPSIPAISRALDTTIGLTQLSVSFFMLGFSFSALLYGPISDTTGRKNPLLVGISLCFIGSCICVFAQNIHFLILGRLVQGLGCGAGISITPAIIRDISSGRKMAQLNSYLSMANMIVIVSAPIIGGILQENIGWHANFALLLIFPLPILFLVLFSLPETKKYKSRIQFKVENYKNNFLTLISSKQFIGYFLCLFSAYAGILAWLTVGPPLMEEYLSMTPNQFGWICFLEGSAYTLGALLNSKLVMVYGISKMFDLGKKLMLCGGLIMLILALFGYFNLAVIILPTMLFTFGTAMIFANSYAGAMTPFATLAGLAAALLTFGQLLGGFVASALLSLFPVNTQIPLATSLLICATIIIGAKKILIHDTK